MRFFRPDPSKVPTLSLLLPSDYPETPLVTVIVPIYNEQHYITRCLNAIQQQDYPADQIEILVSDGQSSDNSRALVLALATADPRIRLIDNPQRLQTFGLNTGIEAAHGQIVVRVDGHVFIAPDYVRNCVSLLRGKNDEQVANVGGLMTPQGETPFGRAIAAATQSPFGIPTAFHHSHRPQFVDTVYLGAWPRVLFDQIGYFNPALAANEDYEFNYRIRLAGGRIYLSPTIRSVYFCRSSMGGLWRQYQRYGRQKIQMLRRYPQSLKVRQLIAPLFSAALFGLPLLTLFNRWFGVLWLLMLIAYGLVGSAAAAKAPRERIDSGRVLLAFALMHVAWGIGFWRGVIDVVFGH